LYSWYLKNSDYSNSTTYMDLYNYCSAFNQKNYKRRIGLAASTRTLSGTKDDLIITIVPKFSQLQYDVYNARFNFPYPVNNRGVRLPNPVSYNKATYEADSRYITPRTFGEYNDNDIQKTLITESLSTGQFTITNASTSLVSSSMFTKSAFYPTTVYTNITPITIVGMTVGDADRNINIPSGVQVGDLLVVMTNDPHLSLSGGANIWTDAFTTTGADFGYDFKASYGVYSSGSTISITFGYNAMCFVVRGGYLPKVSSSFALANITGGSTTSLSINGAGLLFGMATDRGSPSSYPNISGMTFQQNVIFSTTFFGCRAVLGTGYVGQNISATDVNNVFGTQFCIGLVQ